MKSFFSSRPNWDFLTPLPAGEHVPPPLVVGGGGYTLVAGEGVGYPVSTNGQTLWYSRYILYALFGQL